jgi:predicted amidophosphoribosyltransferase
VSTLWATLADLVLPNPCAACGRQGERLTFDVCAACVRLIDQLRAFPTRPRPAPPGLPPCFALGEYGGELRELIIGYKERGRHRLARPLGALLAEAVATAVPGGTELPVMPPVMPPVMQPLMPPLLPLVYIPDTGVAAPRRHGDHMRLLALHAAQRLREAGRSTVVVNALKTRSTADSAELDAAQRAVAAGGKFAVRRGLPAGAEVVLVDDIITTGSTLAAASLALAGAGISVTACVALAATQLRVRF